MSGNLDLTLWYLGRGTGVVALLMFTLAMVLGIVTRSGRSPLGIGRFGATDLHRTASLAGTALLVVHVGSLLFDPYAQLRLVDLAVPFLGSYRPLYLALGTLALDVTAVVVVSSLLRRRLGPRVFRGVHWAAYALWPLAMVHVLGIGTDMSTLWLRLLAVVCSAAVLGAVGWRLTERYAERGIARVARRIAS
ncbi:MAG: ferric reductase-like transmembrane domain-containing protein [Nocardioidaceae bacterium]